jgi:hypothetical protein
VIVVADAGPLIHLAAIGQLELIHRLSPEVLVPQAVFDEVVVRGVGLPGAAEVGAAVWIRVVTPKRGDVVAALLGGGLHLGEAQAIAVAVEFGADRLLIDERQGRLTAEAMGVAVVGSIGILIAAKVRGDLPALAPHLLALRASGLWLSDGLIARVLSSVGESAGG